MSMLEGGVSLNMYEGRSRQQRSSASLFLVVGVDVVLLHVLQQLVRDLHNNIKNVENTSDKEKLVQLQVSGDASANMGDTQSWG